MGLRDLFKNNSKNANEQTKVDSYNFDIFTESQQIEGTKGEVKQPIEESTEFQEKIGIPHPFDYKIAQGLYLKFGPLTAVVDKYVDYILGGGFFVISDNERVKTILDQFMKDFNFDTLLRGWIKQGLIKGFSPLEMAGNDEDSPITGMKILGSESVFIKRDDKGKILKYTQFIPDKKLGGSSVSKDEIIATWQPFQMAVLNFNRIGDQAYGNGIVHPLEDDIEQWLSLEHSMNTILDRKANSPLHIKMGMLPTVQKPSGIFPKSTDVQAFGNKLATMQDKTEFATGPHIDMKVIDFGDVGEKFTKPLESAVDKFIFGSQVPEVLMGRGSIPEGLAKVQSEAFERRIQSFQAEIEKVIETDIFSRVLLANDLASEKVEFEWGSPGRTDTNERIKLVTTLLTNPTINPKLFERLELELAELFNFKVSEIQSSEEERNREEAAQTPVVPGRGDEESNLNNKAHVCTSSCKHDNKFKRDFYLQEDFEGNDDHEIDESHDYTIKEWVNFDFTEYLAEVLAATSEDEFLLLAAQTENQLEAGLLTTPQVEELRDILSDGFKDGKSINEITNEINNRVKPGDRFVLDKEGNLKLNKNGDKILALSGERRGVFIARSETIRLANQGAINNYIKNDIQEVRWVATLSDRTCPICEELDAQVFEIGNQPPIPIHVACRCTYMPVVK